MALVAEDDATIYDKLHEFLKESDKDHNHGDDPIYLQGRLREQRSNLEQLAQRIKTSDDARTVMETRQKNLLTENEELQDKLIMEKEKCCHLRLRLKTMQKNNEKFSRMKEEYQSMCKAMKEENLKKETVDKATSCSNLVTVRNKCTQAWVDCPHCEEGKQDKKNLPAVRLTRSELSRLEKDMQALKTVLNQREAMWCKLAERERLQRVQLSRLSHELSNLRALADSRQSELELKTEALTDLNAQVERHRLESVALRRHIVKLERREKEYADLYELNMELYLKKLHKEQEEGSVPGSAHSGKRPKRRLSKETPTSRGNSPV